MKKNAPTISNPDELNHHLQHTSLGTWVVFGVVVALLAGLFAWGFFGTLTLKITGMASVVDGQASLVVSSIDRAKLAQGQKVYILQQEGEITSLSKEKPLAASFALVDGEYPFTVVLRVIHPIELMWDGGSN